MLLALLVLAPLASADVAPEIPAGKQWVGYAVAFENLAEHPDYALVVHDAGSELHYSRSFSKDGEAQQSIAYGGNNRGQMGAPNVYLLPRAAFDEWTAATRKTIDEQEEACSERNEGCAHISRFVPTYAAPAGAIDCNVQLAPVLEVDEGGPDRIVDVYKITTATAESCVLEKVRRDAFRGDAKIADTPPESTDKTDKTAKADGGGPCAAVPAALGAGWLAILGAALIRRRR